MTNSEVQLLAAFKKSLEGTEENWGYILPTDLAEERLSGKADGYFLLDVRKPEDFARGHIEGSKNIFWRDIPTEEAITMLPRDKQIVIICYVGHTASQTLSWLRALGFNARALKFGIGRSPAIGVPVAGWDNYGFELVGDNA